jgi:hypothetical protein
MQFTSSIEPVLATDDSIVEAPGRHRRNRHEPRLREAPLGPRVVDPPATDAASTPLWTRHTLGAIEAERDRRHARSVQTTVRYSTAPPAPAIPIRPGVLAR